MSASLKIARRIGALLEPEIGVGVDSQRMLDDPRYARDVLLVCDAHVGHELAQLASWFRRCASAAATAAESGSDADDFIISFFDALGPASRPFQQPAQQEPGRPGAAASHAAAMAAG